MIPKVIFLLISAALLICALLFAAVFCRRRNRGRQAPRPFSVIAGGTFLSAIAMFLPVYSEYFEGDALSWLKTILLSIHNSIRLFVVDCDFDMIRDAADGFGGAAGTGYSVLGSVLYVLAPVLTFGFVLSFFRNAAAYRRLLSGRFKPLYVFSDLNERSLALAKSIRAAHGRRALIVFNDVDERNDSVSAELLGNAGKLGAICFARDILDVNYKHHRKKVGVNFFIMDDDDSECIRHMMKLAETYGKNVNASMYVFSDSVASSIAIAELTAPVNKDGKADTAKMKRFKMHVRRINDVRSMLEHNAYDKGSILFDSARDNGNGEKLISALVVGCGAYGSEMTKILAWLCQMDGYRLEINVVDGRANALSRFTAACPELMSSEHNGKFIPGDARYSIRFLSGLDVHGATFTETVRKLPETTYIFVALGDDAENIEVATALRAQFSLMGTHPVIQTPVYNPALNAALRNAHIHNGDMYDIDFIADLESFFSEEVICSSELERKALERHLEWGSADEFWAYEYNYRSSVASAIHSKMRRHCKLPGAEKPHKQRTPEERDPLRRLEHERWAAYVRSEGYIFTGKYDKSTRNNLGKSHHCLVNYYELNDKDKNNDDVD